MTRKEMEQTATLPTLVPVNPQMSQHELELTNLKKPAKG